AAFFVPFGHPCHASKNPIRDGWVKTVAFVRFSWSRCVVVALGILGGIISPIQRRRSGATRRVDSSLRSHRTWRSSCRHVCSGLNKTLFASVGPNLRCRGYRLRCPAEPGRLPQVEEQRYQSDRIKPGRGHRHDGMPWVRSLAPARDIAGIPPHVVDESKGSSSLLSGLAGALGRTGLVGGRSAVAPRTSLIRLVVADHGIQEPQEASSHGHVGLGFDATGTTNDSLANGLLASVGLTEGRGGVAQGPAESARAGLGDFARLGSTGGLLDVGGHAGPELQGIGIGEAVEGAEFRGNDATPDLTDARHRLQELGDRTESRRAAGFDDGVTQRLTLEFDELDDLGEVGEGLTLGWLEKMTVSQQPTLCRSTVELGAA